MRPIQRLRYNTTSHKYEQIPGEYWFHQWVTLNEPTGNPGDSRLFLAAVVEDDNGEVVCIAPEEIRFLRQPIA